MKPPLLVALVVLAVVIAAAIARPDVLVEENRPAQPSISDSLQSGAGQDRANDVPPSIDWKALVREASAARRKLVIGGISFEVPAFMHQQRVDHLEVLTFPIDLPEGPWIRFGITDLDPQRAMEEIEAGLSSSERVVDRRTVYIGSLSWLTIRRTTDLGIDETTWVTRGSSTVAVTYAEGTADAVRVFQDILQSARAE